MPRTLYLVAYDITQPRRLGKVRRILKEYATGGQLSVYECFLTDGERARVEAALLKCINPEKDRVHIFTMDARSRTHTLGIAVQPRDPAYFYVG